MRVLSCTPAAAPQLAPPLIPFVPFRCTVRVRRSVPPPPAASLLGTPLDANAMPCGVRWCMCAGHDGHSGRLQADAASPPTPVRFTCYSIPSVCCVFHSSPPTDPPPAPGAMGMETAWASGGLGTLTWSAGSVGSSPPIGRFLPSIPFHPCPRALALPFFFLVHAAVVQTKRLFFSCAPGSASREIWRCRVRKSTGGIRPEIQAAAGVAFPSLAKLAPLASPAS